MSNAENPEHTEAHPAELPGTRIQCPSCQNGDIEKMQALSGDEVMTSHSPEKNQDYFYVPFVCLVCENGFVLRTAVVSATPAVKTGHHNNRR